MIKELLAKFIRWILTPNVDIVCPGFTQTESGTFIRIDNLPSGINPEYRTDGSVGFDIAFFDPEAESYTLKPSETHRFKTGIFVKLPIGYELQIRPRSSMGARGIIVTNSPGTIDSDYRGELLILLTNTNELTDHVIKRGERIAQGVLALALKANFNQVMKIENDTARGAGGFGSTGK